MNETTAANATAQTDLGCEKKPPSPRGSDGIRGPPHLCTFWSVFHLSASRATRRGGITGSDPWRPVGVHDQHRDGAVVQDVVAGAAQQRCADRAAPARAHHDEVVMTTLDLA